MTRKNIAKGSNMVRAKQPKKATKEVQKATELSQDDNPRLSEETFRFACNREVK